MSKEKVITIEFENGVYLQRLEPLTASSDSLTTQERVIIEQYNKIQSQVKEIDNMKMHIRDLEDSEEELTQQNTELKLKLNNYAKRKIKRRV